MDVIATSSVEAVEVLAVSNSFLILVPVVLGVVQVIKKSGL